MRLLASLAVLGIVLFGCSKTTDTVLAPAPPSGIHAVGDPTADDAVSWTWIDATHIQKTIHYSRWDAKLQRVVVGDIKVLYYCTYPVGFIGPLPAGYCWEDGTHCSG